MKIFVILLPFFIFLGCKHSDKEFLEVAINRYQILKDKKNIEVFGNITLEPRRVAIENGKILSATIPYRYFDSFGNKQWFHLSYVNYGLDSFELNKKKYNDITAFAKYKGIPESETLIYGMGFINEVINIYKDIHPAKINGQMEVRGYIKIKVTQKHELIYCPDTTKLPKCEIHIQILSSKKGETDSASTYIPFCMRKFIRTAEKLDSNWYIKYL